jgi:hypothetical protein
MAKQRHIGLTVFAVCSAISARSAMFEPKKIEPAAAELRWGTTRTNDDPLGFIRGLRYYIYGIGALGLLLVVEDFLSESKRRRNRQEQPVDDNKIA